MQGIQGFDYTNDYKVITRSTAFSLWSLTLPMMGTHTIFLQNFLSLVWIQHAITQFTQWLCNSNLDANLATNNTASTYLYSLTAPLEVKGWLNIFIT